jgi:tRNA (cytidine/uridine-2'-O-)-methyltransferase
MVQIVLVAPEIPANTGNIARTCAATQTALHLVDPLGFQLSDRYLKRAGLDYWDAVDLHRHASWSQLVEQDPQGRYLCFSVRGELIYTDITYHPQDWLVFGSETRGLPAEILQQFASVRIPLNGPVRSLNLSNAVAIVLFETIRQLGLNHGDLSN